ncbi:MAG: hypothetical protein ABI882_14960 [Acidobacteriota bacterium]
MTRKILILLTILVVSASSGRWMQRQQAGQIAGANVIANPEQLPAICRSNLTVNSVELVERGVTSETFLVKWASPELSCLVKAAVTVVVRRRDGSTESKTEFVDNTRQASVRVFGSRSDNPGIQATATVIVNGLQGTIVNKTVSF